MNSKFPTQNQVAMVANFDELVNTAFQGVLNAACWHRNLDGDFKEIVAKLQLKEDVTIVTIADLLALALSPEGCIARQRILDDFKLLEDHGALPTLNLLKCYQRDDQFDFISTDVYSYHVDRSPIAADTFLCTYYGAAGDILPNDEVDQKILMPEIRQQLQALHGGPETEFEEFLKEYFFDLHYQAKPGATPINLGVGQLWKLAVDHPGQLALPCVHRAPIENEGEYRLLLIC